jgi:hypothetical protein
VIEGALFVPGLSILGAGLYNSGMPKEFALLCESAFKSDKLVLVAHGTTEPSDAGKRYRSVHAASP